MSSDDSARENATSIPRFVSDFQCFVCGAILTTDEDREQHLARESKGMMIAFSQAERDLAAAQEAINSRRKHYL